MSSATMPGASAQDDHADRSAAHSRTTGYVGPDRRRPLTPHGIGAQIGRTAIAAGVVLVLWTANVAMVGRGSADSKLLMISLSHGVAGSLLLAAAALSSAVWRIVGTTRSACATIGLTVAGVAAPVLGILTRAANSGTVAPEAVALLAAAIETVLACCATAALVLPAVVARLRPLMIAAPLAAAVVLAAAAIMAAGPAGPLGSAAQAAILSSTGRDLQSAVLVTWIVLAGAYVLPWRRRRPADRWIGAGILVLAAQAGARVAMGTFDYHANLFAAGCKVVVACLVAGVATVALWSLHTAHGTRLLTIRGELQDVRTDLADLESAEQRRLHDARNAIFAIAGATELLAHPTGQAAVDADRLKNLVTAELDRLGHLLDPGYRGTTTAFTAADLLDPLVAAYRAQGVEVDADIANCTLHGRREALANAVTNILTNANVHAPGARIWVSAAPVGDEVRITIADDGPGIPTAERDVVVLPGVRGSAVTAPGSGLGLASAARALSEAHGTLRVDEREGGGTVITMTIPHDPPLPRDGSLRGDEVPA